MRPRLSPRRPSAPPAVRDLDVPMQTLGIVRSSSEVSLAGFRVADLERGERGRAVARASRRVGRTAATAGSCRPRGEGGTRGRGEREGGRRTGARREGREQPIVCWRPRVRDVAFVLGGRLYLARASSVTAGASCFVSSQAFVAASSTFCMRSRPAVISRVPSWREAVGECGKSEESPLGGIS